MKVCILFGGKSGEHEVSLRSAASVVKNLDAKRYEVIAVGIGKSGTWLLQQKPVIRPSAEGDVLTIADTSRAVSCVPADGLHAGGSKIDIDCVFPVLHGSYGEDGTVQGLLEIAGLPYVGAGVLGSSVSMDKEKTKRLWKDAGLPVVPFIVTRAGLSAAEHRKAAGRIGYPLFVKPCAGGSSLGASRVDREEGLEGALAEALEFDSRAMVERFVDAREIECSVIGNSLPRAFAPGEIIPSAGHAFYDYDAKYTDPDGARLEAPAHLPEGVRGQIMSLAESAYAAVGCEGMARIDFFLEKASGEIFLNEINTIPGFTSISMFPRMCEAAGLPYDRLLDTLIELALERDRERRGLRYSR